MRIRSCFLLAVLFGWTFSLQADVLYSVTDLGPGSGNPQLNNLGEVLAADASNAQFLYQDGQKQYLPQPVNGTFSGTALNDLGQVAGYLQFGGQLTYTLSLYSQGNLQIMTNLSGLNPVAMNNAGQIVGGRVGQYDMFLYSNGTVVPLVAPEYTASAARGINSQGDVVGQGINRPGVPDQGFIYSSGQFTPIPPPSAGYSDVYGINDSGQVAGAYSPSPGHQRVFLYSEGQSRDLGPVLGTGGGDVVSALNNSSDIVGYIYAGDVNTRAWIYRPETGFSMLNDEIAPNSGWSLQYARDINDRGQIVGTGRLQGGKDHVFLLTPIPEPSTFALFGVALLGLGAWGRLRHPTLLRGTAKRPTA